MAAVLIILALIVGYAAFVLVKEDKQCGKCGGWGQKTKRRRNKACGKCAGTGRQFRFGAPLVHRGKAAVMRYMRERGEGGQ